MIYSIVEAPASTAAVLNNDLKSMGSPMENVIQSWT